MNKKNKPYTKTILLAEGFPAGQKVMLEILKLLGFKYKTVDNGYDVILLLKKEKFDLLLLDIELPQFNGFETIEHIRRNFNYPENTIPVIAMTNQDFSSDLSQTYKDEGFDGLIVKPFSLDELDLTIKNILFRPEKSEKNVFSN